MLRAHPPKPVRAERADAAGRAMMPAGPLAATAAALNASPAVVAQAKLASGLALRPGRPVQLYKNVDGAKISSNGNLALVSPRELYAADAQIGQANGLKGAVRFDKTDQLPPKAIRAHLNDGLHRVAPALKPNFSMNNPVFKTGAHSEVTSLSEKQITDGFANMNTPEREEGYKPENAKKYKKKMKKMTGPLLPSDCGKTSRIVAGHMNAPEDDASTVMQPGSIYQYTSDDPGREWSYHLAAVTMTDGGDHVTFENAVAKASEQFSKYALDRGWWFDMFGSKAKQSFARRYRNDLPNGELSRIHPPAPEPEPELPQAPQHVAPVGGGNGGGIVSNILGGISSVFSGLFSKS